MKGLIVLFPILSIIVLCYIYNCKLNTFLYSDKKGSCYVGTNSTNSSIFNVTYEKEDKMNQYYDKDIEAMNLKSQDDRDLFTSDRNNAKFVLEEKNRKVFDNKAKQEKYDYNKNYKLESNMQDTNPKNALSNNFRKNVDFNEKEIENDTKLTNSTSNNVIINTNTNVITNQISDSDDEKEVNFMFKQNSYNNLLKLNHKKMKNPIFGFELARNFKKQFRNHTCNNKQHCKSEVIKIHYKYDMVKFYSDFDKVCKDLAEYVSKPLMAEFYNCKYPGNINYFKDVYEFYSAVFAIAKMYACLGLTNLNCNYILDHIVSTHGKCYCERNFDDDIRECCFDYAGLKFKTDVVQSGFQKKWMFDDSKFDFCLKNISIKDENKENVSANRNLKIKINDDR